MKVEQYKCAKFISGSEKIMKEDNWGWFWVIFIFCLPIIKYLYERDEETFIKVIKTIGKILLILIPISGCLWGIILLRNKYPIISSPETIIVGILLVVILVLQFILLTIIEKTQDYSGGNEYSSSAYWATADGKKYMSATRRQTGEWHPPMSSATKLMILDIILIIICYFASQRISFYDLNRWIIAMGIFCIFLSLSLLVIYIVQLAKS
jgi:hypothetical protein